MSVDQRPRYYGLAAIRRSFMHFVLGKGVSAAASLGVLVIIIRELSVGEFAVYTSMHALVLILGLVSSLGVNPVLLRYLPELRAAHNNRAMYRMLVTGIALRVILYALVALVVLAFAAAIGPLLKLGEWLWVLPWYLLVGFLRVNATFAVVILESLLWQRESQYSVAVAYLVKLGIVLGVLRFGTLDLATFVAIECLIEGLTLTLLLGSAFVRWMHDPERSSGDAGVLARDWRRYVRFGLWTYAQGLSSIFYGSAPNRLFVSYFLPVGSIAIFGAVDRFINFLRRYEPLVNLAGMVRPIFNSRFRKPGDFPHLVELANFLLRVNLIVLLVPFILFAIAGEVLFDWLTAGKYGEAATLFLGFYVVLVLGSVAPILDVLIKVVEHTKICTVSNLALSLSLLLAIPLIPYLGLWSLVFANGAGAVLSYLIISAYLKRVGYPFPVDWGLVLRIVAMTLATVGLGHIISALGGAIILALASSYAAFGLALYLWPPFKAEENALIRRFLRRERSGGERARADASGLEAPRHPAGK